MADFSKEPDEYGTWMPQVDSELIKQEQAELERMKSSVPVIAEVLEWFDAQIKAYLDPRVIEGVNPATDPQHVLQAVLHAQSNAAAYADKSRDFRERFAQYIQTRDEADVA